jgi:hypothetical protein
MVMRATNVSNDGRVRLADHQYSMAVTFGVLAAYSTMVAAPTCEVVATADAAPKISAAPMSAPIMAFEVFFMPNLP